MSIASNILEKIGNTPLVRINKLNKGEVIVSAYSCVVLTECGSDMNYTRTV